MSLDLCEDAIGKWRRRYIGQRLDELRDDLRSGAPRTIDDARIKTVIVQTLESLPPAATYWNSRGMAHAAKLSTSSVQRNWRASDLQPYRLETLKLTPSSSSWLN